MKLGNTRGEMMENYMDFRKGSRKLGIVFTFIFLIVGIMSVKRISQILGFYVHDSVVKPFAALFVILYPLCGYAEGHILYFAWKRIGDWCSAIASDDDGFFMAILSLLIFPIMFSVAQIFGLYDWVKIHIDGKRYGLKVK